MSTCQSCGGIIGRDCFNPSECAWITQQQANQAESYYQSEQEAQNSVQQLKAEIAALANELSDFNETLVSKYGRVSEIVTKMRQLSAV